MLLERLLTHCIEALRVPKKKGRGSHLLQHQPQLTTGAARWDRPLGPHSILQELPSSRTELGMEGGKSQPTWQLSVTSDDKSEQQLRGR